MSGQLFAFRVARPVEPATEETVELTYDPHEQVSVWKGGSEALAYYGYCTYHVAGSIRCWKDRYGNCHAGGGTVYEGGVRCDY
jgi:hypothetical protein